MGLLDFLHGTGGGLLGGSPQTVQTPSTAQPSFGQRLNEYLQSDRWLGTMAGLASGSDLQDSIGRAAIGYAAGRKSDKTTAEDKARKDQLNAWIKAKSAGLAPEDAALLASNPDLAGNYAANILKPKEYKAPTVQEFFDDRGLPYKAQYDEATGSWNKIGGSKMPSKGMEITTNPDGTTSITYGGSGNSQPKPPSGYRWSADGRSLEAIPGGPGTDIPAEVAGRIGLADSFIQSAPALKEKIKEGAVTGVFDRAMAGNASGSDQAAIYRQLQSGADALQRGLTGAGMSIPEAQQYAARYLPTYTDTAESAANKVDQLVRELQAIQGRVMQGKGGATPNASMQPPVPPASRVMKLPNGVTIEQLD